MRTMTFDSPSSSFAVPVAIGGASPWTALALALASVETLEQGLAAMAESFVSRGSADVAHWFVGDGASLRSRIWCAREAGEATELLRRLRSDFAGRLPTDALVIDDGTSTGDGIMRLAATLGIPFRLVIPVRGAEPELAFELWCQHRAPLEAVLVDADTLAAIAQALCTRASRWRALEAEALRFRKLMADAPVPLMLLTDEGQVLETNRAARAIFGVGPGEEVALPLLPEGGDDDPVDHVVLRGELGVDRDGQERRVEILAWPVDDGMRRVQVAIGRDITEQVAASRELRRAIDEQGRYAQELSRRYSEIALLSQWAETLETCVHRHEVHDVMSRFGPMLFPGSSGTFFQPFGKGTSIEQASSWGHLDSSLRAFSLEDCWAFRRGVVHEAAPESGGPRCPHVDAGARETSLCIPLLAQGQPLGLLHLAFAHAAPTFDRGLRHELAKTVGEHVSLALANLRLREELRQQSIRDPLTGLHNRRSMEETLERETHRARRHSGAVTVLLIDVDHFKKFNDEHGHDAGDAVLVAVSELLQKRTRGEDLACRYGGEEFLLILAGAPFEAALARAESIRESIAQMHVTVAGRPLGRITVSIGVATLPLHAGEPSELITAADAALYAAKLHGRNRVESAREDPAP